MGIKLGLDGKVYRNTGSYGTPVWDEVKNVKDLSLSLEKGEADVTTRANNGWGADVGTLKRATIEFQMVWDPADTDMVAFRDAFLNNTTINCVILDGGVAVTGSQGLRAIMAVLNFSRDENLEEAMMVNVTIKPTFDLTNGPTWFTAP